MSQDTTGNINSHPPDNQPATTYPWFRASNPVLIRTVKEEWGWLGNMAPYPLIWKEREYRTPEALFQARRFLDAGYEHIAEQIRAAKSPMAAKWIAKERQNAALVLRANRSDMNLMREILGLKVRSYPNLLNSLDQTGNRIIIEDCTFRDRGSARFWGAVLIGCDWYGENILGELWMEIRDMHRLRQC